METLGWFILWAIGLGALAYHKRNLQFSSAAIALGLVLTTFLSSAAWYILIPTWLILGGAMTLLNLPDLRKQYITGPIFKIFKSSIPTISKTEQEALDSGTVGWDGELFSGNPNWKKMTQVSPPQFTSEELTFLEGPLAQVCEMTNDWDCSEKAKDLPPQVWEFLKKHGFFALIIPKQYGGKEFSAYAHAEIVARLSGRSILLSSTVAVPNSLGPSELLMHYGTEQQKNYYLPRLAKGEEIPCFALTGPDAGSDAGSIPDTGIICKGNFEGKEVIGIRLNWDKRYITLAPVATLLGLAFKLYDPDHLIGEQKDIGITCALIPTKTQGITIGRRHSPSNTPFQNGPTQGKDVFIPLDWIIGGLPMAGCGWKMLVECLSVGRAVSLPSTSAGAARVATYATGAYTAIRRQFNTTISSFEGIQEALARIGAFTYIANATSRFTVNFIDHGEKPSVPGAIAKYHVTEFGRKIALDMTDIHGGKAIMQGPNNYIARGYQSAPIGITVEGANILTRCMIIFGQGAVRCHPHILNEMEAVKADDFSAFEKHFGQHTSYLLSNMARSFFHAVTFSKMASSPTNSPDSKYYRQISRASSAFALVADASMIMLGGKLKFKESLSARLGDCLSMMYLGSAVLKQYADDGKPEEDYPFVEWSMAWCLNQYWLSMDSIFRNLPNKWSGYALRVLTMPLGRGFKPPKDILNKQISRLLSHETSARDRLTRGIFISKNQDDPITVLKQAFEASLGVSALRKRILEAVKNNELKEGPLETNINDAVKANIISSEEASALLHAEMLCKKVTAVDDFSNEEFTNGFVNKKATIIKSHPQPVRKVDTHPSSAK